MTSTSHLNHSNPYRIFPNPSTGVFNIQTEENKKINKIKIFNSNGQLVKERTANSTNLEIDLSNLDPNVYYLQIDSNHKKSIKKLVKK